MQVRINNKIYDVEIVKKRTTRNTYIRVKDDLTIYVTTNSFVSDKQIAKLLEESISSIKKMIEKCEKKKAKEGYFYFLGKKYDVIRTSNEGIALGNEKVFVNKYITPEEVDKWYKKEALRLFSERLELAYNSFSRNIPHPTLTVRKMTTRWGVCNTKDHRVTLNLELMKKPLFCLDYVIMHELSHLVYPNHSALFWSVVEENCKEYKEIRKYMKED